MALARSRRRRPSARLGRRRAGADAYAPSRRPCPYRSAAICTLNGSPAPGRHASAQDCSWGRRWAIRSTASTPWTSDGDTQQKTTTGLAYYRKGLNMACFTTGWDHWGLIDRGLRPLDRRFGGSAARRDAAALS